MRIGNFLSLVGKKLGAYRWKLVWISMPITILVALTVVIPSQSENIRQAVETGVLKDLAQQLSYIRIQKNSFNQPRQAGNSEQRTNISFGDGSNYTTQDIDKVKAIDGVSDAVIPATVPINVCYTSDLFDNIRVSLSTMVSIPNTMASQFTDQDFNYQENDAVPVVVNAASFVEQYEEWNGKRNITVELQRPSTNGGNATRVDTSGFPVKTRAIDYDKDALIGKQFTIKVGGLDSWPNYTTEPSDKGITFHRYKQSEIDEKEAQRKDDISPYWNYKKIKAGLSYKVKIVGVINDSSQPAMYVPEGFADVVMKKYIQNQLDARTDEEIPLDLLNNQFQGLTYDGVELTNNTGGNFRGGPGGIGGGIVFRANRFGGQEINQVTSYTIPGLVISVDRTETSDSPIGETTKVNGLYTKTNVSSRAVPKGDTLLVTITSVFDRSTVVKALNQAGYAFQDTVDVDNLTRIRDVLEWLGIGLFVFFVGLSALFIVIAVSKFVQDSKREIGVLRAIGFTKGLIRNFFMTQAFLYTALSYAVGLGLGIGLVWLTAPWLKQWFDTVVQKAMASSVNVTSAIPADTFKHLAGETIGLYAGILAVIVFLAAWWPAQRAAGMSPVDAIRD